MELKRRDPTRIRIIHPSVAQYPQAFPENLKLLKELCTKEPRSAQGQGRGGNSRRRDRKEWGIEIQIQPGADRAGLIVSE